MSDLHVVGESGGETFVLKEVASPVAQPPTSSDRKKLYPKADGWYYKGDDGVEHKLVSLQEIRNQFNIGAFMMLADSDGGGEEGQPGPPGRPGADGASGAVSGASKVYLWEHFA